MGNIVIDFLVAAVWLSQAFTARFRGRVCGSRDARI